MKELQEVVITGLAAITARGDFSLGDDGLAPALDGDGPFPIDGFALGNYLNSAKTYLDRCSALALAGTAYALRDASIETPLTEDDASRFGITLGTHLGCLSTMKGFWDKIASSGARVANPILFSHSYLNSPISLCAIEFGLKGYHSTICAGDAGGLEAARAAFDAIRLGHADAMLCGGVEALTPERTAFEPRPHLSEASVFFVLESAGHAATRNAPASLPVSVEAFDRSTSGLAAAAQSFGDCGGALGALALVDALGLA